MSAGLQITPYDLKSALSVLTGALLAANSGLTITNTSFVGISGQAGTYTGFNLSDESNSLTLPDGILLTNGLAINALGPNNSTSKSANDHEPGDPRLDILAGGRTFDANLLTIQFTTQPSAKSILFDFVFGSEEFPEFVGSFNDAFGAFLDGKQISFDQKGQPVTVNNNFFQLDNNNAPFSDDSFSSAITKGKTHVNFDIQYDGLTQRLTTQAALDPAQTVHTLTFGIADALDHVLDSGVFLARLRSSTLVVGDARTDLSSNIHGDMTPPSPAPAPAQTPTPAPTNSVDSNLDVALAQTEEHRRNSQLLPILLQTLADRPAGGLFFPEPLTPAHKGLPGDFALTLSSSQALPYGSISGRVFEDYDGNGLQGSNEPGLAGQIVYLDANGNGTLDENETWTKTNEKGEYRFQGLTPGAYKVRQVIWTHLQPTQPTSGERLVMLSNEKYVVSDQDFGAVQRPAAVAVSRESDAETIVQPKIIDVPAAPKGEQSPGDKVAPKNGPSAPVVPMPPPRVPATNPTRNEARGETKGIEEESASQTRSWSWIMAATFGLAALGFFLVSPGRDERPSSRRQAGRRDEGAR